MKNQGMSWSLQGIRRMLRLRISLKEGKLQERLCSRRNDNSPVVVPEKQIKEGDRSYIEIWLLWLLQGNDAGIIWPSFITSLGWNVKISDKDSSIMFCEVSLTQNRQFRNCNIFTWVDTACARINYRSVYALPETKMFPSHCPRKWYGGWLVVH